MEEQSRSTDSENMNRRDLVRNAGLATLGMMYTRPAMETIVVESAFASYGNSPNPQKPQIQKPQKPQIPKPQKPQIPKPQKPQIPKPQKPQIPKPPKPQIPKP